MSMFPIICKENRKTETVGNVNVPNLFVEKKRKRRRYARSMIEPICKDDVHLCFLVTVERKTMQR